MRKLFRNVLLSLICCFCICSLVSCGKGISGDEAKSYIRNFFDAIVAEDYAQAETFLHPDRPADIEAFILSIEEAKDLDFGDGIEIEKYTGFSSSLYDSTVGGSSYELTMQTKVGENNVKIKIEIVKNEAGYGIYNFDVNT